MDWPPYDVGPVGNQASNIVGYVPEIMVRPSCRFQPSGSPCPGSWTWVGVKTLLGQKIENHLGRRVVVEGNLCFSLSSVVGAVGVVNLPELAGKSVPRA